MRSRFFSTTLCAIALAAFGATLTVKWNDSPTATPSIASAAAQEAPPLPMPVEDNAAAAPAGAEVLAQGPVHEAFANPIDVNPQPGPIVVKRPPDPVEEVPPGQQPEGDNIVWIPGYWAWDDDRSDFLWISGVLRNAPPGQTWVPGYWSEVNGGYQWTPGFWTAAAKEEVQYLPQPPQSLEVQAAPAPPGENYFWIQGCWLYQDHYVWRPGYWTMCRPNWIWNPAHYVWTPGGFVFVDGYWDYAVARRGCLFAPVYFSQPLYAQAGFVWTPNVLINVGLFTDHLFVRPAYCHYYFGDYYAARYATIGFQPWFSVGIGAGRRYDPLFTYYRWNNSRTDRNWLAHTQQHFDDLRRNEGARPPHTFVAQQQQFKRGGDKSFDKSVVTTISQAAKDPAQTTFKFHQVDQRERQALVTKGKELQQVAQKRVEIEKTDKPTGNFALGGGGGAAGTGNAANNPPTGKSWKLPTAAASKVTLSAQNQGGNSAGSAGNDTTLGGNRFQNDSRLSNNKNNTDNSATGAGTGKGNLNQLGGNRGNQNATNNVRDRAGNLLGQGADSNPAGNANKNLGRGNFVGPGGVLPKAGAGTNSGGGTDSAGGSSSSGGANATNRSAINNGNRVFVPPSGIGRSGGLQSGGLQSGGLQSGGVQSGSGNFSSGAGAAGGGNPSLGNLPRFNGPQLGGNSQSGGNSTSGGSTTGTPRSFTPRIVNPGGGSGNSSSGGSSNKGSGGGQPSGGRGDKDDKNKNSSFEPPRTDMNLQPSRGAVVDVPDVMRKDRSITSHTTETPADLTVCAIKESGKIDLGKDDLTTDRKSAVTTNRDFSAPNPIADRSRIQLPTNFHLRSSTSPDGLLGLDSRTTGNQEGLDKIRGGNANGKADNHGADSSDGANGKSPSLTPSAPGGSKLSLVPTDPRSGTGASMSKFNYQNLRDRGRSMSDRVASDASGGPTETPDVNTLRRVKDPVGTLGLGGTQNRTVYGPSSYDGSPSPTSSSGLDDRPSGVGSYVSPTTLPKMSHFDTRLDRRSTPLPSNDPSSRTYDPARGGY